MRIALTMRITDAPDNDEPRDAIAHDWISRLADWEAEPVLIPNGLPDPAGYMRHMAPDVLIMSGGDDPGDGTARDRTEAALLEWALAENLPVLGVCRGMQVINRHFGGKESPVKGHVACSHEVTFPSPAWRDIYGEKTRTNSFHGLAIPEDGLGQGLVAAAIDAEGRIEAFQYTDKPVAGVMWHPEREGAPDADRVLVQRLSTKKGPLS
jgi:gamma-glutamyl-gamma-aminobutyrate hydrolase PuuD